MQTLKLIIARTLSEHNVKRQREGYDPRSPRDRATFASDLMLRNLLDKGRLTQAPRKGKQ